MEGQAGRSPCSRLVHYGKSHYQCLAGCTINNKNIVSPHVGRRPCDASSGTQGGELSSPG